MRVIQGLNGVEALLIGADKMLGISVRSVRLAGGGNKRLGACAAAAAGSRPAPNGV
jgi:hypothetical protein